MSLPYNENFFWKSLESLATNACVTCIKRDGCNLFDRDAALPRLGMRNLIVSPPFSPSITVMSLGLCSRVLTSLVNGSVAAIDASVDPVFVSKCWDGPNTNMR